MSDKLWTSAMSLKSLKLEIIAESPPYLMQRATEMKNGRTCARTEIERAAPAHQCRGDTPALSANFLVSVARESEML